MTEHAAAKPKGQRAQEDQPVHEPMRGGRRITKAPSTDQKKVRRAMVRKTATELPVEAWKLNPGDYIRGPNNQVVQVRQVRNHKTDMSSVYVDTEAGTIAVPRTQNFTMVPGGRSNRQQELPRNLGLPGGNSNTLPGAPNAGGMSPGESHGSHKCPIDGSNMQLRNQGGSSVYVCPQDGYTMPAANFGFGPSGGGGVTTDPSALNSLAAANYDYEIHGNYGQGWEHVNTEDNLADAKRSLREYNDNEPEYPHKIKTVRRTAALDESPANECKMCGGRLRTDPGQDASADSFTASCEDCGAQHSVQKKVRSLAATASWVGKPCAECGGPKEDKLDGAYTPICRKCWEQEAYQHGVKIGSEGSSDDVSWASPGVREHISRGIQDGRALAANPTGPSRLSRYTPPTGSAIAARALAVLAQEEQS